MEAAERKAFEDYSRDCAGVRLLEWLRREPLTLAQEVEFWERVLRWLPRIFEMKRAIDERVRQGRMTAEEGRMVLRTNIERVFPPGYALGSLESEIARAQCALSKARWRMIAHEHRGRAPMERRLLHGFGGEFGATISVPAGGNSPACSADERRIHPVVEPPASELVNVERRHGGPRQLHRDAYAAYQRLKAAAEADGIPANLLTMTSGYRSVASQQVLWDAALLKYGSPQAARRWVAPPGGSPHHTGRAIDFYLGGRNNSENVAQLRQTAAYRWLVCNAARFGFFPYAAEPWHWEYNPPADFTSLKGYGFGQAPTAAPTAVLDRFDFDQSTVKPTHWPSTLSVARTILAREGTSSPVRSVRLVGHADRTGTESYNQQLGQRRADAVQRYLRDTLNRMRPGSGARITFSTESRGERQPVAGSPDLSRRVEIFLPAPASTPPPPPTPTPPPPAPRPVVCPPTSCTPAGSILPSRHGFKFPNSFSITIPLPRPFPSIPASFGLCGGMATAALDYFLSCIPIPSTTTIPTSGTVLFNYLLRRQLDSLGSPTFGMVTKFLTWTNLPDTRPSGVLPSIVPGVGLVPGVQELTVPEFRSTVASLAAGSPVVLGLVYVGPAAVNIWENHQVLAYGTSVISPTVTDIKIYDPNDPGNDGVVIRCELLAGGGRVRCVEMWPGGRSKTVRGFFRMPYTRVTPPCLP